MSRSFKVCLASVMLLIQCACFEPFETKLSQSNGPQSGASSTRAPKVAATPMRLFLAVFDSSKSYKDHAAAIRGLAEAIKNLGPGDRLILARLNEKLDPKNFMIVDGEWVANKPDEAIFKPTKNVEEWRKRQRKLDTAWQEAEESSQKLTSILKQEESANTALQTDLHGALEYSALWLNEQPGVEKTLIVFSDLENDTGKPSFDPPSKLLDVSKVHVKLLFVTYQDARHFQKIEAAWRKYFSAAASFAILDSGRSPTAMIAPSATPRNLAPPPVLQRSDD